MHHIAWLFVVLVLTNIYGLFLRKRIGYVERPLMNRASAFLISCVFVGSSFAVAYGGLRIQRDAGLALYAVLMFSVSWLGLRYWMPGNPWKLWSSIIALGLTFGHLASPYYFAGLTLMSVALGASVGGYYASKTWLRVTFLVLCVYDVYAVWFSDTMDILMEINPDRIPANLFALSLEYLEVGTLDVILAAVAVVGIQRHRGILRSSVFAGVCLVSVPLLGMLAYEYPEPWARVPYILILAPLVWVFLVPRMSVKRHRA